jgi:hypothetical protein
LSIKNINVFWGRTPDPPIFLTNDLRAGVIEKKVKLGRAKPPPQKRLEWENLIFFAASNANLRLVYIEYP